MNEFLTRAGSDWAVVQRLIDGGQLVETGYDGRSFYMRRLHKTGHSFRRSSEA